MGDKQSCTDCRTVLFQAKTVTEFYENAQNVVQQEDLEKKTITGVLGVEEVFFHLLYRPRDDDDFDSDFKFVYSKNMIIKPGAITTFCYSTPYNNKIVCSASTTCERDVTGQFIRVKIQLIDNVGHKIIWLSGAPTVYSFWAPADECVTAEFLPGFGSPSSFTCCGCQPKTDGNSVTCL